MSVSVSTRAKGAMGIETPDADAMQEIRYRLGLTRDGMAAALNLSDMHGANAVAKYERGARKPSGSVAMLYALYDKGALLPPAAWRLEGAFAGTIEASDAYSVHSRIARLEGALYAYRNATGQGPLWNAGAERALQRLNMASDPGHRARMSECGGAVRSLVGICRDANAARKAIFQDVRRHVLNV